MILASIGEPSVDTSNPKPPGEPVLSSFVFLDTTGNEPAAYLLFVFAHRNPLPHRGHIEVLSVEVNQPVWHSGPDGFGQTGKDFVFAISQGHPHRETLGEILARRIIGACAVCCW